MWFITKRDVTSLALFYSNNPDTAGIDKNGLVQPVGQGDGYVFARFNRFTIGSEVIVLPKAADFKWSDPPVHNYIDKLIHDRLQKLKLLPSALADDNTFLRRVYLDLTGAPPTRTGSANANWTIDLIARQHGGPTGRFQFPPSSRWSPGR